MSKRHHKAGCLFWLLVLLAILAILGLYSFKSISLVILKGRLADKPKTEKQATSRAKSILLKTIELEGGFQNMAADKANYNSLGELAGTNHGISALALETFAGFPVTSKNVAELSQMEAAYIYYQNYYTKVKADSLFSYRVSWLVVDSYVHSPSMCCWAVQRTLTHFGITANVQKEFTAELVASINSCDTVQFFEILKSYRRQWYDSRREAYPQFYKGWINRLNSVQ